MKKLFFAIIGLVIGIALGIGVMYLVNNDSKNNESDSKDGLLKIEDNNCINNDNYNYYLHDYGDGMAVGLEDSRTVSLTISDLDSWGLTNYNSTVQSFTINNFSEDIIDIRSGSIYNALDGSVVIFLMEDGSVEYIPLYKALESNDVRSYGKLEGIEDIVKLYSVSAIPKDSKVGARLTLLAQKADGTFYDLSKILYEKL